MQVAKSLITFLIILLLIGPIHSETSPTQPKITRKILLNAEPFGFGPSAAIAQLFPYLRPAVSQMGFIGKGHVLDLQKKLAYEAIYEADPKDAKFAEICRQYDIFITASDFEAAAVAKAQGLKVIIYDPLTWFWRSLPAAAENSDLYISQNFFNVSGRLEQWKARIPNVRIVPPLVPHRKASDKRKNRLVLNFGGLSNPYIDEALIIKYADFIITTVKISLSDSFDEFIVAGNNAVAKALSSKHAIKTYTPQEMQNFLADSKLVMMTPGLGNIYDAAEVRTTAFWLPPANDSQGQQLRLLINYGLDPLAIDWHDLIDRDPINYYKPQEEVLKEIAVYLKESVHSPQASERLSRHLRYLYQKTLQTKRATPLHKLIDEFGDGGAEAMGAEIIKWLHELEVKIP